MFPSSSEGTDFNKDFGLTTAEGETFGLSTFLRIGRDIFHTYFTTYWCSGSGRYQLHPARLDTARKAGELG